MLPKHICCVSFGCCCCWSSSILCLCFNRVSRSFPFIWFNPHASMCVSASREIGFASNFMSLTALVALCVGLWYNHCYVCAFWRTNEGESKSYCYCQYNIFFLLQHMFRFGFVLVYVCCRFGAFSGTCKTYKRWWQRKNCIQYLNGVRSIHFGCGVPNTHKQSTTFLKNFAVFPLRF